MAVGYLHPTILLPRAVLALPPEQLRMILLHELVHLRRRDLERKLFLLAAACVHWFNPAVWVMLHAAGQDMEAVCDDEMLALCGPEQREAYCRLLLNMAKRSGRASEKSAAQNDV